MSGYAVNLLHEDIEDKKTDHLLDNIAWDFLKNYIHQFTYNRKHRNSKYLNVDIECKLPDIKYTLMWNIYIFPKFKYMK